MVLLAFGPVLLRMGYGIALPVHFLGKAATFNLLYAFPFLLATTGARLAGHRLAALRLGVRHLGHRAVLVGRSGCTRSRCGSCGPQIARIARTVR